MASSGSASYRAGSPAYAPMAFAICEPVSVSPAISTLPPSTAVPPSRIDGGGAADVAHGDHLQRDAVGKRHPHDHLAVLDARHEARQIVHEQRRGAGTCGGCREPRCAPRPGACSRSAGRRIRVRLPPTELNTRCGTSARAAASAITIPVAVSCSVPPGSGVVIANAASTPSKRASSDAGSVRSPTVSSTPRSARPVRRACRVADERADARTPRRAARRRRIRPDCRSRRRRRSAVIRWTV